MWKKPTKFHIFWLQDKFLSRREAILGEVAKNNEVAEKYEEQVKA